MLLICIGSLMLSGCRFLYGSDIDEEDINDGIYDIFEVTIGTENEANVGRYIMSDIMEGTTYRMLSLYSVSAIEENGEENITKDLEALENSIQGDLLQVTFERDGGSGTRGGRGVNRVSFHMDIYTTKDVYSLGWSKVTSWHLSDDRTERKNALGVENFCLSTYSANLSEEYAQDTLTDCVSIYAEDVCASERLLEGTNGFSEYSISYCLLKCQLYYRDRVEMILDLISDVGAEGELISAGFAFEISTANEDGYAFYVMDKNKRIFYVAVDRNDGEYYVTNIADENLNILYDYTESVPESKDQGFE